MCPTGRGATTAAASGSVSAVAMASVASARMTMSDRNILIGRIEGPLEKFRQTHRHSEFSSSEVLSLGDELTEVLQKTGSIKEGWSVDVSGSIRVQSVEVILIPPADLFRICRKDDWAWKSRRGFVDMR